MSTRYFYSCLVSLLILLTSSLGVNANINDFQVEALSTQINSPSDGFNYQALLRDDNGAPMLNSAVRIRFTLSNDGGDVWVETHSVTTSANGMITLIIGSGSHGGGSAPSFSAIDWATNIAVKVEVDSGSGFVDLGTSELQSVPYANYAKNGLTTELVSEIATNSAKVGITPEQAAQIASNTTKKGLTEEQAAAINTISGTNTGDQDISGIAVNAGAISDLETEQATQNEAIALNTAKIGITVQQASDIETNNSKVGITTAQADILAVTSGTNTGDQDISGIAINASAISDLETDQGAQNEAIVLNTAKVGITVQQASDIETNNSKVGITTAQVAILAVTSGTNTGDQDISGIAINASAISDLETDQATQNEAIALNTAKVGITVQQASDIEVNNSKVGITTAQADLIAATSGTNTGDQDISGIAINASAISDLETEQATQNEAIALNTAKVGITTQQASDIETNNSKVGITAAQVDILAVTSGTNTGDQDISGIAINARAISDLETEQVTQNEAIALNTAKVGITVQQASDIETNNVKIGITTAQADIIAATSGTNTGDQDISGIAVNASSIGDLLALTTTSKSSLVVAINETDELIASLQTDVDGNDAATQTALNLKADLESPTFTGAPILPSGTIATTQMAGDNSKALATTAFVSTAASSSIFADLATDQTIAGDKIFSKDLIVNGVKIGRGTGNNGENTAVGNSALGTGTGTRNSAFGYGALMNYVGTDFDNNTSVGYFNLISLTSGSGNTSVGAESMMGLITGVSNTSIGNQSLINTQGNNNVGVGKGSGSTITTGSNNTILGTEANVSANDINNSTAIGFQAVVTSDNTVQLGSTDLVLVNTSGAITSGGIITGNSIVKSGGTSSQFLKADGSVDSNVYLTSTAANSNFLDLTTNQTVAGSKTFTGTVTGIDNAMVGLGNVDNTSDANKPISNAAQNALDLKVDMISGKGLSSEDYTSVEKTKLGAIEGSNTGDQDISGIDENKTSIGVLSNLTTQSKSDLVSAINETDADLDSKVDKVSGKGLSTEDFTTVEKNKLAALLGTNTGDQDISGIATNTTSIGTLSSLTTSAKANIVVAVNETVTALASKAPLASPTFTGTPSLPTGTTAVTQSVEDNSTAIATTAFVNNKIPVGNNVGDMQYWNGSAWVQVAVGSPGQFLQLNFSNVPTWSGVAYASLTTTAVSSLASTSVTSGGTISSEGGASITERGVCWSTSSNPTMADSKTSDGTETGAFSSALTALTPETTYHVRAFATNSLGTSYGNEIIFTTPRALHNYTLTFEHGGFPFVENGTTWSSGGTWNDIRDYGAPRTGTGAILFMAGRDFELTNSASYKLNYIYLKSEYNNATQVTIKAYDSSNNQVGSTLTFTGISDWDYSKLDINLSGVKKIVIGSNATDTSGMGDYGSFWVDDINYDY